MQYREATTADTHAIAALHAESWRSHYRGTYRDEYLDGDVFEDRRAVWEARMSSPDPRRFVTVAEADGRLLGFACAFAKDDERWGTLLDNIHVEPAEQGRGIGARLFHEIARWCRTHHPDDGLFLWVLAENHRAQRFYARLGATDQGGEFSEPPGGGQIHGRRYAWRNLDDIADVKGIG